MLKELVELESDMDWHRLLDSRVEPRPGRSPIREIRAVSESSSSPDLTLLKSGLESESTKTDKDPIDPRYNDKGIVQSVHDCSVQE